MSGRELFSTGVHPGGSILFMLIFTLGGWVAFQYFAVNWKYVLGAVGAALVVVGGQLGRIRYTVYADWVEASIGGQERGARVGDITGVKQQTGALRTLFGFSVVKISTDSGDTLKITNPADANGFVTALNRAMTQSGTAAHA